MIFLSAPTYDVNGHIAIDAYPENIYSATRRGNVTKTLDGGVAVYDGGFSSAGEVITASFDMTKEQAIQIAYMIANYPQLILTIDSGAYRCVASCYTQKNRARLSCTIIDKVS